MTDKELLLKQININKVMIERIQIAIEYLQYNRTLPALQCLQQIFTEIDKQNKQQ